MTLWGFEKKTLKTLFTYLFGAAIIVIAALWLSNNYIVWRIGSEKVIRAHWYGWVDEADAQKFGELLPIVRFGDPAAARKMLDAGLKAGLAREFAKGEIVYVTDRHLHMALVKVRPQGEFREYWIDVFWVGNIE